MARAKAPAKDTKTPARLWGKKDSKSNVLAANNPSRLESTPNARKALFLKRSFHRSQIIFSRFLFVSRDV
jgi:hypothetical protein